MWNYQTKTTTYEADAETTQFLTNIEQNMKDYWLLKGYTPEQMEGVDFKSNIHNSIISLFRRGGLSPKLLVEYLILTTSYDLMEKLNDEYKQEYKEIQNKMNSRINKIIKNSMKS